MLRNIRGTDVTSRRNVQDLTNERNVMLRNIQGQTLQVKGMYRDRHYKREECTVDRDYM